MATLTLGTWQNGIFAGSLTPASSAALYLPDQLTLATVYADKSGTSMTNPFPTGRAATAFGIDVQGNVGFAAAPGDYALLINGLYWFPVVVTVDPDDVSTHFDDPDGHGARTYADSNFLALADLGQAGGAAQLDENGVLVTGQVLMTVNS